MSLIKKTLIFSLLTLATSQVLAGTTLPPLERAQKIKFHNLITQGLEQEQSLRLEFKRNFYRSKSKARRSSFSSTSAKRSADKKDASSNVGIE